MGLKELFFGKARDKPTNSTPGSSYRFFLGGSTAGKRVTEHSAMQMTQDLEGMGFTVVPFGQGYKDMSPPTKEFYKLLMEGKIIHGGNPVMKWMSGNVVVDTDPAGNIKCTKAKSPEKIDGIVAAIMALDRCIRHENTSSVYDERGLLVF